MINLTAIIPSELAGKRLDAASASLFPDYSRNRLQEWIRAGELRVNGEPQAVRYKVAEGDDIEVQASLVDVQEDQPENIPLNIIFEDEHLLVVNKPAGMVVHPAAGIHSGTLLNALLYHYPDLAKVPRAGIVHRLDKDTSGLMVVAKTIECQLKLVELLKDHNVERVYHALVNGVVTSGFTVDAPVGRHPTARTKMAVVPEDKGKHAITHVRVLERFQAHTLLECQLETGRTHQIRVHLAHKRYPIFGDPVYAPRAIMPKGLLKEDLSLLQQFKRQALCAVKLSFIHPFTGELCEFEAPLSQDVQHVLTIMKNAQ